MESVGINHQVDFAAGFLTRLRKVFHSLHPMEIRELEREGILYFTLGFTKICLYNVYRGNVQVIFNRDLLDGHFDAAYDFSEQAVPDWRLLITIIANIIDQIQDREKEVA